MELSNNPLGLEPPRYMVRGPLSFVKTVCAVFQISTNAEFRLIAEFEATNATTGRLNNALSYTELQLATGLSHQSLSNALKSLKKKSLIVSIKDQVDRRVVLYQLHQQVPDLLIDLNNQMILLAIDSLQRRLGNSPQSSNEIGLLADMAFSTGDGSSTMNSDIVTTAATKSINP